MDIKAIQTIYFIGIGGIGMSAIARYFNVHGVSVYGYDKTPSPLTDELFQEGIHVNFEDNIELLPQDISVVVYTPAIPKDNKIFNHLLATGIPMMKRAEMLGHLTLHHKTVAIAGTHGKTTTSSMVAHILTDSGFGCQAFIGGIAINYNSNFWGSDSAEFMVVEADEYDRSFLKLSPQYAILTSIDADHLDIYGSEEECQNSFIAFTNKINPEGLLVVKQGLKRMKEMFTQGQKLSYALMNDLAESYATNIIMKNGSYTFDVRSKYFTLEDVELHIGGMHNIENVVAAITMAQYLGIPEEAIKSAVASYKGIKRRFEYVYKSSDVVYIDDYAHHPEELRPLLKSAMTLFGKKRTVVIFQPHLYSRTRDFAREFAHVLDAADEVILLDIYPARELPIDGVSSQMIKDMMGNPNVTILSKEGVLDYVKHAPVELLITAGAGDIDRLVPEIKNILESRFN